MSNMIRNDLKTVQILLTCLNKTSKNKPILPSSIFMDYFNHALYTMEFMLCKDNNSQSMKANRYGDMCVRS